MFVLQRRGTKNFQAKFKILKYHTFDKYKAHDNSLSEGFDIAVAEVEIIDKITKV